MKRPTLQIDPHVAWLPYEPTADEPWDAEKIVRLHRRAGFGISRPQIERDLADGYEASVSRVLNGETHGPDGRTAVDYETVVELMADSCLHKPSITRLTHLWLYRMLLTPFPLAEKMTLVWHGHYSTNNGKVNDAEWMSRQHFALRKNWRANARVLHLEMLRDPAMLRRLDGFGSRKEHPNENLAREFFELFALGEGHYTERDVRESARTLTGWHRPRYAQKRVEFVPEYHDDGDKTLFRQKGPWGAEDLVRITCGQPAAAAHLALRLWRTFISDTHDPSPQLLEALAERIRKTDDVDVARGIEVILRSSLFFSDVCRGKRIASPTELVIGALRACTIFPPNIDLSHVVVHLSRMGQRLFYPPSVAGWPDGLAWLRGPTVLRRANFAAWFSTASSGLTDNRLLNLRGSHGEQTAEIYFDHLTTLLTGTPVSERRRTALLTRNAQETDETTVYRNLLRDVLSLPEAQTI